MSLALRAPFGLGNENVISSRAGALPGRRRIVAGRAPEDAVRGRDELPDVLAFAVGRRRRARPDRERAQTAEDVRSDGDAGRRGRRRQAWLRRCLWAGRRRSRPGRGACLPRPAADRRAATRRSRTRSPPPGRTRPSSREGLCRPSAGPIRRGSSPRRSRRDREMYSERDGCLRSRSPHPRRSRRHPGPRPPRRGPLRRECPGSRPTVSTVLTLARTTSSRGMHTVRAATHSSNSPSAGWRRPGSGSRPSARRSARSCRGRRRRHRPGR